MRDLATQKNYAFGRAGRCLSSPRRRIACSYKGLFLAHVAPANGGGAHSNRFGLKNCQVGSATRDRSATAHLSKQGRPLCYHYNHEAIALPTSVHLPSSRARVSVCRPSPAHLIHEDAAWRQESLPRDEGRESDRRRDGTPAFEFLPGEPS